MAADGGNIRDAQAEHATQLDFLPDIQIQTPKNRHRQHHGGDIEKQVEDSNVEVQRLLVAAVACSSDHPIPTIRDGAADEAVCEHGTKEEDHIYYEDRVADSSKYRHGKQADVEKDNGGAD